jgi:malonyl-CoA decarboxylase
VSAARLATAVLAAIQALDAPALDSFFDLLLEEFSPDPARVDQAAAAYRAHPSPTNLIHLQKAVEPPRQELFRRFNLAPAGLRQLIEMRRRLLGTLADHPQRITIDADLVHLLRLWFNGGFLVLQQIDWRTSALVLERLIQYEGVHQIQGWRDLHRRLEADRRCYALFHPSLPDEPLIFIEVALTRGMSAKVQPLLDPDAVVIDPRLTDCATFYSITSCHEGLRGLSFGNSLINQAVADLGRSFPRLKTFATLSPIPGFMRWLATATESPGCDVISAELAALLARLNAGNALDHVTTSAHLQFELSCFCAYYLLHAKRGKVPLDPVARFHLANGARLERLNWLGDTSEAGIRTSFGLSVNYVYRLGEVKRNHQAYARAKKVSASCEFERLAAIRQSPVCARR